MRFIGLTYFLSEVLSVVEQVSKIFQERGFQFTEVQSLLTTVREGVLRRFVGSADYVARNKVNRALLGYGGREAELPTQSRAFEGLLAELRLTPVQWRGHQLQDMPAPLAHPMRTPQDSEEQPSPTTAAWLRTSGIAMKEAELKLRVEMTDAALQLAKDFEARFPEDTISLPAQFGVLHPGRMAAASEECSYGAEAIAALASHYGRASVLISGQVVTALLDGEALIDEWERLVSLLIRGSKRLGAERDPIKFLVPMLRVHGNTHPSLRKLVQIMLVVECSTAEVERGFSRM